MSVAFVKKISGQSGASSTTITLTLASAPAAGNFLLFAMAGDKNTGALTLSGFTQIYTLNSTSVSLYLWYRISDGTETSISPSWATSSVTGNVAWYGEFADAAVSGSSWQISGQASHNTDETNVTSWSTGTTGTISLAGLSVGVITMDSADSVVDGTTAWTNSYASLFTTLASAGARGGLHMSSLSVSAGGTTETTFSYTASTSPRDQLSGAVAVLTKVVTDVTVNADQPSATGAAFDTAAGLSALPDTPSATGAGQDAIAGLSALPGTPSASGVAFDAVVALSALPDTPSASGTSGASSVGVGVLPDTPLGSGTSYDLVGALSVIPGIPTGTGSAFDSQGIGHVTPTGHEDVSGREPSGRTAGYGPVSSLLGREPVTRVSGQEVGHT